MSTNRLHITEKRTFGGSTLPATWIQITYNKYEPTSEAPFFKFKLPPEILVEIISFMDIPTLKSLALVDWDCCQLARSCIFSSFQFNYSEGSQHLLAFLEANREPRLESSSIGKKPRHYLGACIRRIFLEHSSEVYRQDWWDVSPKYYSWTVALRAQRIEEYETYVRRLRSVIHSRHALPKLEVLDWANRDAKYLKSDSWEFLSRSENRFQ